MNENEKEFDVRQLESYADELRAIKETLDEAYIRADIQRGKESMFLTGLLALERLADKIERGE